MSVLSLIRRLSTGHCPHLLLGSSSKWAPCCGAVAAARRRLLHGAPAARSISPARRALSSAVAAVDHRDKRTYTVVKVDRRIRWHYTTTILRLRIGARLTRYRNCRLNFTILLALSAGTAFRLVLAHLYPWTYRRVDAGPLHRPCSTYYASVVNKQVRSVNVRSFDFDFITPSPTVKPSGQH